MQASLPADLVPVGTTTLVLGTAGSCAAFLAIGQALFQTRLSSMLSGVVPADMVAAIASAGATNLRSVVSLEQLPTVLRVYSMAVTEVFVCTYIFNGLLLSWLG